MAGRKKVRMKSCTNNTVRDLHRTRSRQRLDTVDNHILAVVDGVVGVHTCTVTLQDGQENTNRVDTEPRYRWQHHQIRLVLGHRSRDSCHLESHSIRVRHNGGLPREVVYNKDYAEGEMV
jgi:hypothetical protein